MTKQLFIMRGQPGSGKSYWVEQQTFFEENTVICSADNFFYRKQLAPEVAGDLETRDGLICEYQFDPKKIGEAHASCMENFIDSLKKEAPKIVIDNTHSRLWEYENYVALGDMYGYDVHIHEIGCMFIFGVGRLFGIPGRSGGEEEREIVTESETDAF